MCTALSATSASAQVQSPPARLAFELEIQAPADIRDYLLRHIELQRYRDLLDLDDAELARLMAAADVNVRELMGTLGYFSADIQHEVVGTPQSTSAQRKVALTVLPGLPTRVAEVSITFAGPVALDTAAANQRLEIQNGWALPQNQIFTQAAWGAAKAQALRSLLAQRYPTGNIVDSQADIDPDTQTARLRITLDSGPAYQIGPLQVSGLKLYDAQLVTRLARLPESGSYDQNQLLQAQQRLVDSGFFDSVFVSLDTTGSPSSAPVVIQLKEAKRQKVVFGIGANTDSGMRLSVEHTHHKVPGLDWRAVSKLSLDRDTRALGSEMTAPPDANGTRWVTSALWQSQTTGTLEVQSQRYRVGRTQAGELVDRNYYLQYDRADTLDEGLLTTAFAVSANYAWTQRNFNTLPFPSSGYGLGAELGGGVTLDSSRQPYLRAQVRWLGIWPLSSKGEPPVAGRSLAGRIAVRSEVGAVWARDDAAVPSTQLFITGGDTSVRGYAFRSIGTELPNGTVAPGRYLAVASAEWQRPILVNDRPSDWETTLFVDAGGVANSLSELHPKVGVGAGIRWKSPVGPLQADVGYGVASRQFRLHLTVGFSF